MGLAILPSFPESCSFKNTNSRNNHDWIYKELAFEPLAELKSLTASITETRRTDQKLLIQKGQNKNK
jgi:hypothetical protein